MQSEPRADEVRYDRFNDSPGSTHNLVVGLVPERARVLEFGCATGYMSAVLRDRLGCSVTGVEVDRRAAEAANAVCEHVIVGDAEQLNLEELLEGESYGAVLFADVLEHLKDPGSLLRRVRPFLAEDGLVVASIPNVSHGSLRLALLAGEFRYRDAGLLDETHLRFFTRASIEDLFEEAGYVVTHWLRQRVDVDAGEIAPPPGGVPDAVREWLAADPEVTTYQFVVQAVPSPAASLLLALLQQLAEAEGEIARLRPAIEEARELEQARTGELLAANDELTGRVAALEQELESVRRAHEVQSRRLVDERIAMTDHVSALERQLDLLHRSRSFRYTQPFRTFFRFFVPRR
jgi:2-polyprenyl-3-methyl-5-hydroxy-6-metoxy-1,4-benzoquinol methylase